MKIKICLLLVSLALCANTYRLSPPQVTETIESLWRIAQSGKVFSENEYRLLEKKIQNLLASMKNLGLHPNRMGVKQVIDKIKRNFAGQSSTNKVLKNSPPLGNFERYKCVGEYEVYKLMGLEQYYNANAKVSVTMETNEDGSHVEKWNNDGNTYVAINNGEEVHMIYSDGREVKVKRSESVDGWVETEMNGIKSRHKRTYLSNNEYMSEHIYSKDGKIVRLIEYYRRV